MDEIVYRPYRAYSIPICIISISTVLALCILLILNSWEQVAIIFLLYIVFSILLLKNLFAFYRVIFSFDSNGFIIKTDKHIIYECRNWGDFSLGYYYYSYKGHRFLVLSNEKFDLNSLKKFFHKYYIGSKVYLNNSIVIYLNDFNKGVSGIEKLISDNIELIKLQQL